MMGLSKAKVLTIGRMVPCIELKYSSYKGMWIDNKRHGHGC